MITPGSGNRPQGSRVAGTTMIVPRTGEPWRVPSQTGSSSSMNAQPDQPETSDERLSSSPDDDVADG